MPGLRSAPVLLLPDKSNELVAGLISAKAVEIETAAYRGLDRVFPVVLSHVRTTQCQAFKRTSKAVFGLYSEFFVHVFREENLVCIEY